MKVQKLINQYNEKIQRLDKHIGKLNELIRDKKNADNFTNVDDLKLDRKTYLRDRQIYFQFTKDLEDLI